MDRRFGVSWGSKHRSRLVAVVAAAVLGAGLLAPVARAEEAPAERVIVRIAPGIDSQATIASHGGTVAEELTSLQSVVADVPADALDALRRSPGVIEVAPDTGLQLVETQPEPTPSASQVAHGRANAIHFVEDDFGRADQGKSFDALTVDELATIVGADAMHRNGIDGSGVDVAVIDTGIAPVEGVGNVVNGADLSFESQAEELRHLDTNGHGTHLAGIISGLAPGSRLVNVKVGAHDGAVDVSQVIAAIDWVIQHRNDNGLDIRVLNLAYGTQTTQDHLVDPLSYAAEVAWKHGIVVVTAAGNAGTQFDRLTNPAINPHVLAVGASEAHGTYSTADDTVAEFSSRSTSGRGVDLVAPGRSVVSLRTPGSYVDEMHPEGRASDTEFRGSGTSQSAAVTAAAAALLIDHDPTVTADEVKAALTKSAKRLLRGGSGQGAGILDVDMARRQLRAVDGATQNWPAASGTGTLEGARGTSHISLDGNVLEGEIDIFGNPWDGLSWSGLSWSGLSWSGGDWNGSTWTGLSWSGLSWSGLSWSGLSWSGLSWSGLSWSGLSWSGLSWSGLSWSGLSWSGLSWSGLSWSDAAWS